MEPPIQLPADSEASADSQPTPSEPQLEGQTPAETEPPAIRYGGFWRRTAAFLLDVFVMSILSVPATVLTLTDYGSTVSTIATIVTAIVEFAYLPFCWTRWGVTVGMALMGLRVVRLEDLQRISWWRALGRLFALYPASIVFGLGVMWVGWEPRKRGWHDRLADTLVLRVPSLRESHSPRRKWAIAVAVIGAASFAFSLFVGITVVLEAATHGYRDSDGNLRGTQVLSLSALRPGDCFDEFLGSLASVSAVRCSELHTYEVFGTAELRRGSFPSEEEMQEVASDKCIPAFNRYVGIDFEASTWYVSYLEPDPGSWLLGERTLTCFLMNEDETRIRGSAKGSAQ